MSRDGWIRKRANAGDDNGWASRGGYMAAKVSKLDEQFKLDAPREKQKEGACSNIFSGVAIYVNGYTDPNADELRRLMMLHGGLFHVYYSRSKTTHIIANNLPNSKIQELKGEKVVRPEWITDSIKAGCLLPYLQYQLYAKQKGLSFPIVNLRQAQEAAGSSYGLLQPSLHQTFQPPQDNIQRSVLSHEPSLSSCHDDSIPSPSHNQLHPGPQPSHVASIRPGPQHRHLSTEPKHNSPLSNPSPITHPHNPSQSSLTPPHPSLQHRKRGQLQPQISLSSNPVQSGHRELDLKL
ncbi:uncharacterized protein ACN63O_014078 [Diretmus argenteus]